MAVRDVDVVDGIGTENRSGDVVLTIVDDMKWGASNEIHLMLLQGKLNTYLRFIESEEILSAYPQARGRRVRIEVVGKYNLDREAGSFYKEAAAVIRAAGFDLSFRVLR